MIGLLAAGKDNCCKIDPRKGHQLDFIDDLQKKEEEARLKAEAERKAAEEKAAKEFAKFKKCSDIYYSKWLQGTPLQKLTVACN